MIRTSTRRVRGRPDALELPFLQHPEELALHFERQVADFIEEDGATIGQFEASLAQTHGSREGALFVTEQFAFDEAGRERRAIHADKRARSASAPVVDGAGEELFSGTRLTKQQYRAIQRGDLREPLQRVSHDAALADDLVEIVERLDILFQADVVGGQAAVQPLDLGQARTKRGFLTAALQGTADDLGEQPRTILDRCLPLAESLKAAKDRARRYSGRRSPRAPRGSTRDHVRRAYSRSPRASIGRSSRRDTVHRLTVAESADEPGPAARRQDRCGCCRCRDEPVSGRRECSPSSLNSTTLLRSTFNARQT